LKLEQHHVALLVGSNRRESLNAQLARALVELAPPHLRFVPVGIDDLPMYNADLDPESQPAVRRMKEEVGRCSALLVVTPEHNRSIPAVQKSAIDWGSKPMPTSVWREKAVAIAGASPGRSARPWTSSTCARSWACSAESCSGVRPTCSSSRA